MSSITVGPSRGSRAGVAVVLALVAAGCAATLAPPPRPRQGAPPSTASSSVGSAGASLGSPGSSATASAGGRPPSASATTRPGPPASAGPQASAGPAQPAPGGAGSTRDVALWRQRLISLYGSYSLGPAGREQAYRRLFAPRLRRFLSKRDVTVDQVIRLMESFFRTRENPYYVVGEVVGAPSGSSARARVAARWNEPCPAEVARESFACERRVRLDARAEADGTGAITVLDEASGGRLRYQVAGAAVAAHELARSGCDSPDGPADLELQPGTVVEATGRYIQSFGCGPCETLMEILFDGQRLWTTLQSCSRVYDDSTGPHTDAEDYLTELP